MGWILLSIVFGGFLGLLLWLLLMPFELEVDTAKGVFRLEWKTIARILWLPEEGWNVVKVDAPFFHRKISVMAAQSERPSPNAASAQEAKSVSKRPSQRWVLRAASGVLFTFRVRRCILWLDTGDYVQNAWLYPIFGILKNRHARVIINFLGKNDLSLLVQNNLGRMAWAVLKAAFSMKQSTQTNKIFSHHEHKL